MKTQMRNIVNNATKTAVSQGAGEAVSKGFALLMTAAGLPEAVILTPLVKGAAIGVMNTCYDDLIQRKLSIIEGKKVEGAASVALQTFLELAEADGVTALTMQIEDSQIQYAYEVAEGLMLTAIRQSEQTKVDILGRYYGRTFYKGVTDWQDMHQMITMAGTLTLRQIVMIRLIAEEFKGLDKNLFIGNPSACVEINRLKDFGIWRTTGAAFGIDESRNLQLDRLQPTEYAKVVSESLMLERLSEADIKRTIESLRLTKDGTPQSELTVEDYKQHTEWQEFDDNGNLKIDAGTYWEEYSEVLEKRMDEKIDASRPKFKDGTLYFPDGTKSGEDEDDGQFLYDVARGK